MVPTETIQSPLSIQRRIPLPITSRLEWLGLVGVTVTPDGSKVYVTNLPSNDLGNISAIDTQTKQVIATVPVGLDPWGLAVTPDGSKVYVAVGNSNIVAVFNTTTNSVATDIPVGKGPQGVAVSPDGSKVFVSNFVSGTVSVISTVTNTVVATIDVGNTPEGVAISPDGAKAYITNFGFGPSVASYLSIIDTATNQITATISPIGGGEGGGVGDSPFGVVVSPDGSKVYVTNFGCCAPPPGQPGTVSVVSTATNTVVDTITVGFAPLGISITPDGRRVYVANDIAYPHVPNAGTVSVIDTSTDKVIDTITGVGEGPIAFGIFIPQGQPLRFAGRPGAPNCIGVSTAALAKQYHGIYSAVGPLGFTDLMSLQNAIARYCGA